MTAKTCPECGTAFESQHGRGRARKYCTVACRGRVARRKAQTRDRSALPFCTALHCRSKVRSSGAEWCELHYGRIRRNGDTTTVRLRVANGSCHYCGGEAPRKKVFCSDPCRRRDRVGVPVGDRLCAVCRMALPDDGRSDKIYCSLECSATAATARRYGLTARELASIREAQAGRCAVCKAPDERLFVDHNHSSGSVRGLLCGTCNSGIGMLKDNPEVLEAAATYLRTAGHYGGVDCGVGALEQAGPAAEELGVAA